MRFLNVFIFLVLSSFSLFFASEIKFSTNFVEIFFSKESIKLFSVAKKLGYSNEILIAKKGFDNNSLNQLYKIGDELKKIPEISNVSISRSPSKELQSYYKKNFFLLADFNSTKLTKQNIHKRLQKIYDNIENSFIYIPVNSYDPLELFHINLMPHQKYLKLKNYGFILKAKTTIDTANAREAKILYDKIENIVSKHPDSIAFSPFFYLVENSSYIKHDAQKIMTLATILLLVMYFFMLKNYKLFFNTILVIGNSILSAILISAIFFESINILALVFGVSITTISVDYMFHYYFHNDFTQKSFIFQKRVFGGFITTFGVFVIFSFIKIELFAQLAFFSAVSLLVAYILFSWTFVYLNLPPVKIEKNLIESKSFNPLYMVLISSVLFAYSYENLTFDTNMKNLDYHNRKLLNISQKFKDSLDRNRYKSIVISAKTEELLLQKYEKLFDLYPSMLGIGKFVLSNHKCQKKVNILAKYNFERVKKIINSESQKIGFSKVFLHAYNGVKEIKCNMKPLDEMQFHIIKDENVFYTMALIDAHKSIVNMKGVERVDLGQSLSKDTESMKNILMKYMLISVLFILLVLFLLFGLNFLYPLSYVLFPVSVVLFCITLFGQINIMHMFALIILIAVGIDYGIYMHHTTSLKQTRKAILYALLSTLSGFGILIFSNTMAMYSIGFVITIGIMSIFTLLYMRKKI